jgi:hypothetical protein
MLSTAYLSGEPLPGVHPKEAPVPGAKPNGLTGVVGPEGDAPIPSPRIGGVSVRSTKCPSFFAAGGLKFISLPAL